MAGLHHLYHAMIKTAIGNEAVVQVIADFMKAVGGAEAIHRVGGNFASR